MANPNNPFGFEPIKADGKEVKVSYYEKSASAIYPGDAVKMVAAGTVEVAAAGDVIIGVAAEYKSASSTDKIAVYDDPALEFVVQMSGTFAATDVGLNANIVANAADTTLKQSNHTLNSATMAADATMQFTLLGLHERGENAVGNYAIVRCKPNLHFFKAAVVGV